MEEEHVGLFYRFLLFIGIVGLILTPAIPLGLNQKLSPGQYLSQIFVPSTISLVLVIFTYFGLSSMDYNPTSLQFMTIAAICGASLISLMSISFSWQRIKYAAF